MDRIRIVGGQRLNVLVVEDHPVNRMILEAWMSSAGHTSSTAENGQIALEMAADEIEDLIRAALPDAKVEILTGGVELQPTRPAIPTRRSTCSRMSKTRTNCPRI